MNSRIKELAQRAGHSPLEPRTFADDLQEVFLQKFAELIIRECAEVALREDHEPSECILNHFGLEK